MSDPTADFNVLLAKGHEYYACARHMNPRGAADVITEVRELVRAIVADGRTFGELLDHMERVGGRRPDPENDLFLATVKKLWSADAH